MYLQSVLEHGNSKNIFYLVLNLFFGFEVIG